MSRRPNPAADRAEQNRLTLKSLVKLEANKSCADCKRNKHPRWASWNLGIFICIRCSGIHRGMGTHISRVKSVDLDSWTDEQLQSMIKWGNARANKYWEAKLAPGHVPSETKMENFIRTKYDSKRWVADGGVPDPSTLDISDDDVPLKKVQEKVQIERSASQRLASNSRNPPPVQARPQPGIDLFGDEPTPQRPSTGPPGTRLAPKAEPAPPKQTKAGDSLLGLDFLGDSSPQPARPSSTGPAQSAPSRPDLKQSILSLYASAPKPPPQPQAQQQQQQQQQQQHARQASYGVTSPGLTQQQSPQQAQQAQFGGMADAFGGLSFSTQPAQPPPKPSPFAGLDSFSSTRSPPSTSSAMFGGGGSFFDAPKQAPPKQRGTSTSSGFGDFSSFTSPTSTGRPKPAPSGGMNDLLDLSMPAAPPPKQTYTSPPPTSPPMTSAFNLSSPTSASAKPAPASTAAPNYSGFNNMDAWGSTDAWASPAPSQPAAPTRTAHSQAHAKPTSPSANAWGAPAATTVTQDDDFGGWSTAAPAQSQTHAHTTAHSSHTPASSAAAKPAGGFGGGDDLFSNVWE
ncbi:ArfGap-domain-containing protein [Amniculicola lignicola CBS 123094]|uniref:ArfGap-domain-containing protein n=1 Tax=Amniculicola lignicola CBS 123094 TaxID=1392246 RepID=A0A6A5WA30_9PLEO|nr:ArfGap-domain-containing protein [Amniculicola lignicola CBS 123094]